MGPATGVGGVAGVRRRGWKVWLESGDRGGRCGWGPTRGGGRCGRDPATGVGNVAGRKQ